MHMAAFADLGMADWHYQRLPVPPELFAETARALPQLGFRGANVTIPHKEAALALAASASPAARQIGAANTLIFDAEGEIAAENTDAPGLLAAIRHAFPGAGPAAQHVLLLGAGGSARAALWALRGAGAAHISVWARRPERALALTRELGGDPVSRPVPADLLVNCTPVGLARTDAPLESCNDPLNQAAKPAHEPTSPRLEHSSSDIAALNQLGLTLDQLREYSYVVDLVYRSGGTPLLRAARSLGLHALGGGEILVRQGAASFELWTGRRPSLEVMRAAIADPGADEERPGGPALDG
ncbi:MAG: shikimate dehydrogenase [Acidobacteriota bacterium]|nr:shikimate dehydrogenase [Acidobacteriota bacterium]